jgi:hypothetical protein
MSEYVQIGTSIADIISIANGLKTQGEALTGAMRTSIANIEAAERDPETFPHDEFTDRFLDNYHKLIPTGDGSTLEANQAIKQSAAGLGAAMTSMAEYVANAMWTYQGQDDDNAGQIAHTGNAT